MLLHKEFIRVAKKKGNKLAIRDKSRNSDLSYRRTLIASLILAKKFKKVNDHFIGIMLPTSAGSSLSVIATLFAGKVPVMINYSTGAEANVKYARKKCGFKHVITSRIVLEKVGCPEMDGMIYIEDILKKITTLDRIRGAAATLMPTFMMNVKGGHEDDTAVVLFTSGSEKDPKGVELTHRNIYSNVDAVRERFQFTDDDIMLSVLPLFHVFGFTTTFWLPILLGLTTVTYANPLEFKNVAQIIRDEKPTILIATPYFLANYLKQSKPGDFNSLRYVVAGADKVPEWLYQECKAKHSIEIIEGYGATETSPVISVNPPSANRRGSVGLPLAGVQVKILDLNTGEEKPTGEEGKILAKGPNVMKGYFDDLEETSLKVENGWYETGDMGIIDEDGYIWHRGRLKRFTKLGGEMVSLVQIESVLEELLDQDIEVCVVELPDDKKGAMIVAAVSQAVDESQIRSKLKGRVAQLAIPKHFIVIEEMPKMGSGKVDFRTTTEIVREYLAKV